MLQVPPKDTRYQQVLAVDHKIGGRIAPERAYHSTEPAVVVTDSKVAVEPVGQGVRQESEVKASLVVEGGDKGSSTSPHHSSRPICFGVEERRSYREYRR